MTLCPNNNANGKCFQKNGSGSTTCHRRFQEWVLSNVFQKLWVRLLKLYDDLRGIKWKWQSLDSISVKAPLGGR
jgi:transposase